MMDNKFYKQIHGAAMGSPISPIVANLYMEFFEEKAIRTAERAPHVWLRYVDDTFVVLHEYDIDSFTNHINSIDPHIKFTREEKTDGKLPFLETEIVLQEDATLKTLVYRKPTHTDQYLNWESNHHLEHKRSVVRTLIHRMDKIVSEEEDKKREYDHIKTALMANGYTQWSLKLPKKKQKSDTNTGERTNKKNYPVGLPYITGLSENLQRLFSNHGVNTYHKPSNTIRSLLVKPKDKLPKESQCGVVYHIPCPDCKKEYIGETARTLDIRFKEHTARKYSNSPLKEHMEATGHKCSMQNVKVIEKEDNWFRRRVKEAIHIRRSRPTVNRDAGMELPHIYSQFFTGDTAVVSPTPMVPFTSH
jgi:hypothetical protein